jgi:hypothetical protein
MIGFKAAAYLAETGRESKADEEKSFMSTCRFTNLRKNLLIFPRVAYVYMLQTQGLLLTPTSMA